MTNWAMLRSLWLLLALLAAFLFLAALSVVATVREVDRFDIERTERSVLIAIEDRINRLAALVSDNAFWDDATLAVYSDDVTARRFTFETWGTSTLEARGYTLVSLYTPRRGMYATFRNGSALDFGGQPINSKIQSVLETSSHDEATGGGIVEDGGVFYVASIRRVRPTSSRLLPQIASLEVRYLVMMQEINQPALKEMGRTLSLGRLGLFRHASINGSSVPVKSVKGEILAYLSWESRRVGLDGLMRAVPTIVLALLTSVLLTVFVLSLAISGLKRLQFQAFHDGLSKLPNRRALTRHASGIIVDRKSASVALVDLDGFKTVNDTHGHAVGDALIKMISALLAECLPEGFFLARLGGDEFAILAGGENSFDRMKSVAKEVLAKINTPFVDNDRWLRITASIGLAVLSEEEGNSLELLRRADVAMYAAKRAGKNRIIIYHDDFDKDRVSALAIESDLRAALACDEFQILYQPIVSAKDQRPSSVEALLRWHNPKRGSVPPDTFIPIAEESGLIVPLGLLVLEKACSECRDWNNIMLSVNVSPVQLRCPEFAAEVARILQETDFPPDRLDLEVTETYLVDDPDSAFRSLRELSKLGVRVSLDDFGSGFASIGFLRRFPFDRLKIDRSLVAEVESNESSRALIHACANLARSLSMTSVGEGVETQVQADILAVMGVDELQGWWFSRALTAESMAELLFGDSTVRQEDRIAS
jgi:diguanylate cyclase (GGDEF)-like protein